MQLITLCCCLIVFASVVLHIEAFTPKHCHTSFEGKVHQRRLDSTVASKVTSDENLSQSSKFPEVLRVGGLHLDRKRLLQTVKALSSATAIVATIVSQQSRAAAAIEPASDNDRNFVDRANGFSIAIPVGFSSMPRKKAASDSLTTGVPVEILLVAQDFLKGASLSVGRSNVPQLLDDFSVPWAGKPINSISDVGTANIVSELLILQVLQLLSLSKQTPQ